MLKIELQYIWSLNYDKKLNVFNQHHLSTLCNQQHFVCCNNNGSLQSKCKKNKF